MKEELALLIEWVREASPTVWGYAIKQVRVTSMMSLAWCGMLAGCAVGLVLLARAAWRRAEGDELSMLDTAAFMSSVFLAVLAVLLAMGLVTSAVARLVNPEWYAIQMLLGLVGK